MSGYKTRYAVLKDETLLEIEDHLNIYLKNGYEVLDFQVLYSYEKNGLRYFDCLVKVKYKEY